MAVTKKRVNDLERKLQTGDNKIYVCWCNRSDGLHDDDCPGAHLADDERAALFVMNLPRIWDDTPEVQDGNKTES